MKKQIIKIIIGLILIFRFFPFNRNKDFYENYFIPYLPEVLIVIISVTLVVTGLFLTSEILFLKKRS